MSLVNRKNPVPELQRQYQAAFRAHTRLWKINPKSKVYMAPYLITLYGSMAVTLYGMGRKVAGYNSFFGSS